MSKPYQIVFTTINYPKDLLNSLVENIKRFGHLSETKLWIVGDHKTPPAIASLSREATKKGMETVYLDIKKQDEFGAKFKDFYSRIPYNNETRRNIGYLFALQDGCEILISIDDDNFPTDDDFIGNHIKSTGKLYNGEVVVEESGFYNICEHLEFFPSRSIFPRGFPFRLRGTNNTGTSRPGSDIVIGATAGLWLIEPDIDAATWLNGSVKAIGYNGKDINVLDQSTWTPINTQNTSIAKELIPAFLCIPMGWELPGGKLQRYGDIWGGYFLQAVLRGTKYHIAFGRPLVEHRRNQHDYVDDLRFEYWGMIMTDWLLKILATEFKPNSNDIKERVVELADFIENKAILGLPNWCPIEIKDFLSYTAGNLRGWVGACKSVSNKIEL